MRKNKAFGICLGVALMGLAAAMPATAATLNVNAAGTGRVTTSVPFYFPNEAYKPSAFNSFGITSAKDALQIQYVPDVGITDNDVVFTIGNGTFQAPDSGATYQLIDSSTGGRATSTNVNGSSDATVGATTLTFKKINLVKDHYYTIVPSTGKINFTTMNNATPQSLSLSVAQGTSFNTASLAGFVQFTDYWVPTFTGGDKANAVIDVAQGRTKFESLAVTDKVKVVIAKEGTKKFVNSVAGLSPVETAVQIGGTANDPFSNFIFSLGVADNSAISKVEVQYTGDAVETLTYDAVNKQYTKMLSTSGEPDDTDWAEFTITVNGTSVLNTRAFTLSLSATGAHGYSSKTYMTKADAGSWTLNGYQALAPYFYTNTNYGTMFILNNMASTAADVFWDTVSTSDPVVNANLANYSNKQVTGKLSIPANSTMYFSDVEVFQALGLPQKDAGGNFIRSQVRVTVTSSPGQVTGMAIQEDGTTGKRTEPLFTGSLGEYKAW